MQEAAPAENEEVIHCEEEHSDPIQATMHAEDLVQQMVEQATRAMQSLPSGKQKKRLQKPRRVQWSLTCF